MYIFRKEGKEGRKGRGKGRKGMKKRKERNEEKEGKEERNTPWCYLLMGLFTLSLFNVHSHQG